VADVTPPAKPAKDAAAEICQSPDVNQPGGPFHPSSHPNIVGRERELRALADSVRRLIAATNANSAPAEQTAQFAQELADIAERLEAHIHPNYDRYATNRSAGPPNNPRDLFQYDYVLGPYNPLALPLRTEWKDPVAYCYAEFTHPYEGPPGCVHGAVLAAAFDQVFNIANMMTGAAGPTGRLTIHYHKPTPLNVPITFEAQVASKSGSKIITKGLARCGDVMTVRAQGLFIEVSSEKLAQLRSKVIS